MDKDNVQTLPQSLKILMQTQPDRIAMRMKDYGIWHDITWADYLEKVMVRITYVGAGFLAVVAVIPTVISTYMRVDYTIASFYGGTGLLIAVSVAFDLVQKIDSHLVMMNKGGLLEADDPA